MVNGSWSEKHAIMLGILRPQSGDYFRSQPDAEGDIYTHFSHQSNPNLPDTGRIKRGSYNEREDFGHEKTVYYFPNVRLSGGNFSHVQGANPHSNPHSLGDIFRTHRGARNGSVERSPSSELKNRFYSGKRYD